MTHGAARWAFAAVPLLAAAEQTAVTSPASSAWARWRGTLRVATSVPPPAGTVVAYHGARAPPTTPPTGEAAVSQRR